MRNWLQKWTLPALAAILLLALVVVPLLVERVVENRVRAHLDRLPATVEWRDLDWFWGTSVAFYGLEGEVRSLESFELERAEVNLTAASMLSFDPRVEGVTLHGLRAHLSLRADDAEPSERQTQTDAGSSDKTRPPRALRRLSAVRLSDAQLVVSRGGRRLGTWSGDLRIRPDNSARGSGEIEFAAVDDSGPLSWKFDGEVDLHEQSASGDVTVASAEASETSTGPRGVVEVGPARVAFSGLSFRLRRESDLRGRVTLRDYRASIGRSEQPGLRAIGPELGVELGPDRRIHVTGASTNAVIAPGRLLADLRRILGPGRGGRGGSSTDPSAGRGLLRRLHARFVSRVDLTLKELGLEIRLRGEDGWRSYRPADDIRLHKRGPRISVAGAFAGGKMAGRTILLPGRISPEAAWLQLRGVELGEMPVVRKGRSLPQRGVRGEIGGTVDLTARVTRRGAPGTLRQRVRGEFDLQWRDGWVEADGLATDPVRGIDTTLDLTFEWQPSLARVRLRDSRLTYGPVHLDLQGRFVDWGLEPQISLEARTRQIKCQRAVRSLPDELLGPYRDVAIEGEASPVLTFDFPLDRPSDLSFDLEGLPGPCKVEALNTHPSGWPELQFATSRPSLFVGIRTASNTATRHWAAAPDPSDPIDPPTDLEPIPATWSPSRPDDVFWLRKPFIKRVTEGVSKDAEVRVGPGLDSYVPLEALPTHVAASAYLSEEINFYDGGPWNTHLIQKALQLNFEESRFVYGGSTVTQQLVKNLFLTRRKTLARKVQEALVSWRIQHVVSKDRVLELYLNCIEFGEDVYGIGPAARHYFQKPATELSILEGVFLAVLKPAPWFGDKFMNRGTTPESGWWRDRIREIANRLVQKGFITEKQLERAKPFVLKWGENGSYEPDAATEEADRSKKNVTPPDATPGTGGTPRR